MTVANIPAGGDGRVFELEADRGRARDRVEGRRDQRDTPREHLAREGRDHRVDPAADLDAPELVLEDLGNDPDAAQVGDLEEDLPLRDVLTFVGRLFGSRAR